MRPRNAATLGLFAILILVLAGASHAASRSITDMAGTTVSLPQKVERVITVGPVPVLNSLVFAVGGAQTIANGLPPSFARSKRWRYQFLFAPQMKSLPIYQAQNNAPELELLLGARPDVVLAMDRGTTDVLRRAGLPAVYVSFSQAEDTKAAVRLIGQILNRPEAARDYERRFDSLLGIVSSRLAHARITRPRVLYFQPGSLTQPHLTAEWWIRMAGGESLTDDGRSMEQRSFTLEQLLSWNPDIMVVPSREDAQAVLQEGRFAGLSAVRNRKVLVSPGAAHVWGHRSSELPLMVLWAAKQFHPALFSDIDLVAEVQRFYKECFGTALTTRQIQDILAGSSL